MPGTATSPADLVDLDRYPIEVLDSRAAQQVIADARQSLAERGVAILPGFVRAEAIQQIARDALELQTQSHLEDVWGTPYLDLPDESYPEGHPRRAMTHSLTHVIAYDLVPSDAAIRALYEWDRLKSFLGAVLERDPLYRMADPLGALNLTVMERDHVQGWHFDSTDFVVSLAVQASDAGGDFECASMIRTPDEENYDDVGRVLDGTGDHLLEILPMTPGTLMVFVGRHSLHRVSPVVGDRPRIVALLAYDATPHADASDLLKLVRYGRVAPISLSPPNGTGA